MSTSFMGSMNNLDINAVFKMSDITPKTQNHLSKVYAVLASGIVSMVAFSISQNTLLAIPPQVCIGLAFVSLIMDIVLIFTREKAGDWTTKLSALSFYIYSVCFGSLFGYGFSTIKNVEEQTMYVQLCITALIYTSIIFTAFSLFALLTVRRAYIFFGSLITSLVLSIFSIFLSPHTFFASIIGLGVGVLYVIVDTQMIIHKTEGGRFEVFRDAKELFIDFIKIMIEILNILSKLNKDKEKKRDD